MDALGRKAKRIMGVLNELYPNPPIPLHHSDSFTLLVAVMLSAQTTDKKVNEVTPSLFALAPTPEVMRTYEAEQLQKVIATLGLAPQKARALKKLSERLCDVYDNAVPRTFEDLESLAGVGHKTASVVMAQAFGVPSFPVDTHIHRLAKRWGLSQGINVVKTEKDLKNIFAKKYWNRLHLQMIYFGREHCQARGHNGATCPICSFAAPKKDLS